MFCSFSTPVQLESLCLCKSRTLQECSCGRSCKSEAVSWCLPEIFYTLTALFHAYWEQRRGNSCSLWLGVAARFSPAFPCISNYFISTLTLRFWTRVLLAALGFVIVVLAACHDGAGVRWGGVDVPNRSHEVAHVVHSTLMWNNMYYDVLCTHGIA